MSQDLAGLGFAVDSSQVAAAAAQLGQLRGATEGASRAHAGFALQQQENAAAAQALRDTTAALNKEVVGSGTALDALMQKLDQTRTLLRSSNDAMKDFSAVRLQVDALGQSFGVTSSGLEAYYRQAQLLNLSTPQTVQSLQRITEALQNQSAQGQQVRRVLQDYGVSLAGLGINDADKALKQFTERMQTFADSAQKFRSASIVLGPMDSDSFGKLNTPDYVPIAEKKRIDIQNNYSTEIADRTRNATLISHTTDRNQSELDDLRSKYSLGYDRSLTGILSGNAGVGLTGLSADQRASIASKIGQQANGGQLGTDGEQLEMLRYLSKNPQSEEARSALGLQDRAKQGITDVTGAFDKGYLMSGKFGANNIEIGARYLEDKQNSGLLTATGRSIGRQFDNLFGNYKPMPKGEDIRPQDPLEKYLTDQTAAQNFATRGDSGLLRKQQADAALQEFSLSRTNTPLNDRTIDTRKQYEGVYGKAEGQDRMAGYANRMLRQRDTAMLPGQAETDQNAEQSYLLSLPPEQRGQVESFLKFARTQPNADIGEISMARPGAADIRNPDFVAPGGLSKGQVTAFNKIDTDATGNRMQAASETFFRSMSQAKEQTAAAGDGAGALEKLTVKQQAYNQALAEKKTPGEIDLAQMRALIELDERRNKQAAEMLGNMAAENKLENDRVILMQQAGSNPVDRAAASATSSVTTEYAQAKRSGFSGTQADFEAQKRTSLGTKGTSAANDIVATTEIELKNQRELLSVSSQRMDVQAKFAADQKVEQEFVQAMGLAQASGDNARIEAIRKQIEETKELRSQIAQVNQEAKNFTMARDLNDNAAFDRKLSETRDPQLRRQMELQRSNIMDNRSTSQGQAQGAAMMGSDGSSSGGGGDLSTAEGRKQYAFQYFISRGDSVARASGQLANLVRENSELDPAKPGDFNAQTGRYEAYGLGQYHAPRQEEFSTMMHKPIQGSSVQDQLRFFHDDPDSIWSRNQGDLNTATPYEAGSRISRYQVRPKDQAGEMAARGNLAEEFARTYGANYGMRQRAEAVVGGDDATALKNVANSQDVFAERQRRDDLARAQAGSPGDAARTRAGFVDPTANQITALNSRDQSVAGVISGQRDSEASTEATAARMLENQKKLSAASEEGRAAISRTTREQQINQEVSERGNGIVDVQLRNQQLLGQSMGAIMATMDSNSQKSKEAAEDSRLMTAAYQINTGAASDMRHALETAPIEREIKALKDQGVAVDDLTRKLGMLQSAQAGANKEAANAAIAGSNAAGRNRNAFDEQDNELGAFASDRTRARARSDLQAEQDLNTAQFRDASPADKQSYREAAQYTQTLRETTEAQRTVRDGMSQIGEAAASTFNNAVVNGGRFRDIVGSLTKEVASLLLKMAEKPLMNAGSDFFQSLLGFGRTATGGAGGLGGTGNSVGLGGGASVFDGAGIGLAAGNAFVGGTRMFANGGVLDRPTHFFSAGGQSNVAGEVGDEAVMPLKRMPNGDMGVASGGGGRSITVNAPISVNGSGGGGSSKDGKMDPAMLDALQKQLADTVRASVLTALGDEQRPGGLLYR